MPKKKIEVRLRSCGIYESWDPDSPELPRFIEATRRVEARVGVEFGLVVNILGAKNKKLNYCIDHPGIHDDAGKVRPPFDGTVYVEKNDWNFYLGDTVWEPIFDKLGQWRMTLELDGKLLADEVFELYSAMDSPQIG